jgi:hypothetical protein
MQRFFVNYNPSSITNEFLNSDSWDVIELPFTVDKTKLEGWYYYITKAHSDLEFSFFNNQYIKEEYLPDETGKYGYSKGIYGEVTSWGLDWPAETSLPVPPPFAAKPEYYPELFDGRPYKLQEKYKLGYFLDLCKTLGESTFNRSRITQHADGAGILGHVDGPGGCIRLHIPIVSHIGSKFLYGENLDREYSFETGKVYLINSSVWHATTNTGGFRAHIISDPSLTTISDLLKIKGQV